MKGEIFLKVVMDHKQFMKWKYNDKSLASIKLENLNLKRNKRLEKALVTTLALMLMINAPVEAKEMTKEAAEKFNETGNEIMSYIRLAGRWIFSICGCIEIIKTGMRKGSMKEEAPQILIKYGLLYACLHLITIIFSYIDNTLG